MICGYTANQAISHSNSIEFKDVQKNELSIYSDFFNVDDLIYTNNHLNTKIYLNEKGKIYNSTDLFTKNYKVNVSLIDNQSDEAYIIFDEINWNINEDLSIDFNMNEEKINDKMISSDFENQLNQMQNKKSHNIMYRIEIMPENNSQNIMRTIGMLHAK